MAAVDPEGIVGDGSSEGALQATSRPPSAAALLPWRKGLVSIAGLGIATTAGAPKAWLGTGAVTPALLVTLAAVAGVQVAASWGDDDLFRRSALLFVALAILAGIEVFYLRDFLDGSDWRRMNTVFKFSLQVWVLLSLVAGAALPSLWHHVRTWGQAAAVLWRGGLALLLAASLVYPVMALPVRVNERCPGAEAPRGTLDGTAYMRAAQYAWPDAEHIIDMSYDRAAIAWLWDNVTGVPVLAEGPLGFYREGGLRVSSYTGLPTLLGAHQWEQRPSEQVALRQRDAEAVYNTTDPGMLMELLRRHNVRYVYVGQVERYAYGEGGASTLEALARDGRLERAYHNDRVDIYAVPAEGSD